MLERGKMERGIFEIVDTESLVPVDHLLRKIDAAVDFTKIYEMVANLMDTSPFSSITSLILLICFSKNRFCSAAFI